MIEEFLNDLQELQSYKEKYESAQKDKQRMSDKLYELMYDEYLSEKYSNRVLVHIKEICSDCRFGRNCSLKETLPDNIMEPIKSDKAWIPGKTVCKEFRWS